MKFFDDLKDWSTKYILDPEIGKYTKFYYFKKRRAPTVQIRSRLAQQLSGYALIEKDLRTTKQWINKLEKLHKATIPHDKKEWFFTKNL